MGSIRHVKLEAAGQTPPVIDLDDIEVHEQSGYKSDVKMPRRSSARVNGQENGVASAPSSFDASGASVSDGADAIMTNGENAVQSLSRTTPMFENGHHATTNQSLIGQTETQASTTHAQQTFTIDAMQALGSRSRELISVIRKLEQLNIRSTLPSLPKFVVVGDQSAGKSSIIEAICDITLPRSSGTCTRCPFEITTTTTDPASGPQWACKILIRKEYAYEPRFKAGNDPRKFDRWMPCAQTKSIEFARVEEKGQLERMLRCAQLAVLNPGTHESLYQNADADHDFERLQVTFSPNIVSLEITGHDLPELSLYDLPGAINRHEKEDEQHLVKFIEKLTKLYVSDEKTSVLLACAADVDVENSTAFRFVGECKAISRCMGVLTKADLMTSSKVTAVGRMLAGDNFRVGFGWFITKQASQEELDNSISHVDARLYERRFFEVDPRARQLGDFTDRFGVPAIQDAISAKLTEHIIRDLPEIVDRVQNRLSAVDGELRGFPEQPVFASHEVTDLVIELAEHISKLIRPDSLDNAFRNGYRVTFNSVRRTLEINRPHIIMTTPGFVSQAQIISDEEDTEMADSPSKSRKLDNGRAQRLSHQSSTNGANRPVTSNGTPRPTPRRREKSETAVDHNSSLAAARARFTLEDIRLAFDNGSNTELPNQTNPRVTEQLIKLCIGYWKKLVDNLLNKIQGDFHKMLQDSVDVILNTRKATKLYSDMSVCAQEIFQEIWETEAARVRHIVTCETHRPITYHPNLMRDSREAILKTLTSDRRRERVNEYMDSNPMKKLKMEDKNMDDALGSDDYKREIDAIATPLAYYDMAAARMLDTIASHLDYGVLYAMQKQFGGTMRRELRANEEAHCQTLLAEDPQREQARQTLIAERERLQQAIQELQSLMT